MGQPFAAEMSRTGAAFRERLGPVARLASRYKAGCRRADRQGGACRAASLGYASAMEPEITHEHERILAETRRAIAVSERTILKAKQALARCQERSRSVQKS